MGERRTSGRDRPIVIIGAGAAGLAAAARAAEVTDLPILVLDREHRAGGILRQCIHTGFGLDYFGEELTGPEYLSRLVRRVPTGRVNVKLGATVIGLEAGPRVTVLSEADGYIRIEASAVVLATGSYERTRENLIIAGTRPAGVFTAGQAQHLINLHGYRIGSRAVIQGTGDVGLIMTRRLRLEGYEIAGVYERLPAVAGLLRNEVQCLRDLDVTPQFRTQITEIHGTGRVSAVTVAAIDDTGRAVDGTERQVACDTAVISAGLLPNRELLREPDGSEAQSIFSDLSTGLPGVFVAGNCAEIHDLADGASRQGELAAESAAAHLNQGAPRSVECYRSGQFRSRWSVPAAEIDGQLGTDDVVCIVCPRGCVLTQREPACRRGEDFLEQERTARMRTLTTTKWVNGDGGRRLRVAVRSKQTLPLRDHRSAVEELKGSSATMDAFEATEIN